MDTERPHMSSYVASNPGDKNVPLRYSCKKKCFFAQRIALSDCYQASMENRGSHLRSLDHELWSKASCLSVFDALKTYCFRGCTFRLWYFSSINEIRDPSGTP